MRSQIRQQLVANSLLDIFPPKHHRKLHFSYLFILKCRIIGDFLAAAGGGGGEVARVAAAVVVVVVVVVVDDDDDDDIVVVVVVIGVVTAFRISAVCAWLSRANTESGAEVVKYALWAIKNLAARIPSIRTQLGEHGACTGAWRLFLTLFNRDIILSAV